MSAFDASKESILENLDAGVDFSFKGSIDAPILELVHFLNSMKDYFTTSSCSGRVSVFRSGLSAKHIKWILVKHRQFTKKEVLGAVASIDGHDDSEFADSLVTLKCEAFILHINCRDLESAKSLHNIATLCGFRESGIKLGNKKIILAVRTTANGMELPIAKGNELIVSDSYLDLIINECNARLASNFYRIDKFLLELKRQYRWPILQIRDNGSAANNTIRRWGHACCGVTDIAANKQKTRTQSTLVVGGYGSEAGEGNDKCKRGLPSLVLPQCAESSVEQVNFVDDTMHAVGVVLQMTAQESVLLLCGGRRSPGNAVPDPPLLRAHYMRNGAAVECVMSGDVPDSRWGHTLTLVRENCGTSSYLVYGGRNSQNVFGDAYFLHVSPTALTLQCVWERLNLSASSTTSEGELPQPRFFHAACITLSVFPVDDAHTDEFNMVVVHGGILSIDDGTTCGKAFLIDPNHATVSALCPPPSTSKAEIVDVADAEAVPNYDAHGSSICCAEVRRFGHTLTSVGAKCLLLVGGASFQPSQGQEDNKTHVIDLCIDTAGLYRGAFRTAELVPGPSGVQLPCQACRVHHQAVYNAHSRTLHVTGGGAMTLAFGAHFCASLQIQLRTCAEVGTVCTSGTTGSSVQQTSVSHKSAPTGLILPELAPAEKQLDSHVLFAAAGTVRALKMYLETHKFLDKSRSIAKVEDSVLRASFAEGCPVRLSLCDASAVAQPFTHAEAEALLHCDLHESRNMMAIPLTGVLLDLLQARNPAYTNATCTTRTEVLAEVRRICSTDSVLLGHHATRTSKRTQVNSAQKANDLLTALGQAHQLPVCATSSKLHSRFEVVGDVLMLPEHYLTGQHWERILGLQVTTDGVGIINVGTEDSLAAQYRRQVFGTLAQCFGLTRVARKAEIDSGPKRESKVRLLHPVLGMAATTGPSSAGWVTVYENKISYSFDITRVMFCSGNVTERMRMAHQPSQRNVSVDFYCGIGYYTVPLLLHGKAQHVHACEWNPNSVLALRENLRRAGVSERCTVYEGDNRISAERLVDLADRVLLGLLPSSVQGWPLAVRALKGSGGTIHVHENVHEGIMDTWVEETRAQFEVMLRGLGKQLTVRVLHLERVKSYAPRVYHVVLDLACEPN